MEPYHEKRRKLITYYEKEVESLESSINNLQKDVSDDSMDNFIVMLQNSKRVNEIIVKSLKEETLDINDTILLNALLLTIGITGYSDKKEYIKKEFDYLEPEERELVCSYCPGEIDFMTLKYIECYEDSKKETLAKRFRLHRINKRIK